MLSSMEQNWFHFKRNHQLVNFHLPIIPHHFNENRISIFHSMIFTNNLFFFLVKFYPSCIHILEMCDHIFELWVWKCFLNWYAWGIGWIWDLIFYIAFLFCGLHAINWYKSYQCWINMMIECLQTKHTLSLVWRVSLILKTTQFFSGE